jgi:hypothetical protein
MWGYWYNYAEDGEKDFALDTVQRLEDKLTQIVEKEIYDEIIVKRLQLNIKAIKYYYSI